MARVQVIADTHCPGMRHDYVDFLLQVSEAWKIDTWVHIGDLVDWGSISYHEHNPELPGPQAEYEKAQKQVAELKAAFPNVHWLIGNHDCLPHRKATTAGLPAAALFKPLTEVWGLPDWHLHPRFHELVIDDVIYAHGDAGAGGQYAHRNQAVDSMQSRVIGHFHSIAGVEFVANMRQRNFGMAVGCGCDSKLERFSYGKKYRRKPINSCGVVIDGVYPTVIPMEL